VEDNLKRFNTAMESQVLQKTNQAPIQPNSTKPIAPIVSYHTVKQRRRHLTELGVSGLTKVDTPATIGTLNDTDAFVKRRRVSDVNG
jgi:hypothetical protein